MNVKSIGSNQTVVTTGSYRVLVSYSTPVACFDAVAGKYYRTGARHSNTTSKHINRWLRDNAGGWPVEERPQSFF